MSTRARRTPAVSDLKQERAIRTRALILDAAAQAFADKGYPDTTLLDVAQRTGATKGAVYFHFANKNALAIAVAEEFYVRLRRLVEEAEDGPGSPIKKIVRLLTRTGEMFRDDTVIKAGARLQIEQSLIDADLPTPFVGYGEAVTELLKAAEAEGELPAGSRPEVLGRVLVAAFFGAQHMSWVINDRADVADRVKEVLDIVLPGGVER